MNTTLKSSVLFHLPANHIISDRTLQKSILKYYDFMLQELIEILEVFFIRKKIGFCDPHVGEASCQIRAYKNIIIARENRYSADEIQQHLAYLANIHEKTHLLIEKIEQKKSNHLAEKETLEEFLENNALLFDLPKDFFYLVQGRVLSIFSIRDTFINLSLAIDYNKFCQLSGLSLSVCKNTVSYFQKNLSKESCDFILSLLEHFPDKEMNTLSCDYLRITDNRKRELLPCYENVSIILKHASYNHVPLCFIIYRCDQQLNIIDRLALLFLPTENTWLLSQHLLSNYLKEPSLIIEGITVYSENSQESKEDFLKRFIKAGSINILLANMAAHPQYVGKELEQLREDPYSALLDESSVHYSDCLHHTTKGPVKPEIADILLKKASELKKMQLLAQTIGCNESNPTLFLAKHICSNTLEPWKEYFYFPQPQSKKTEIDFFKIKIEQYTSVPHLVQEPVSM